MSKRNHTVAEKRNYNVVNVESAKKIGLLWLERAQLQNAIGFGLPEVDDRYHYWRVPLINKANKERLGEVVIDARTSLIIEDKSTALETLEARLLGRKFDRPIKHDSPTLMTDFLSSIRNTIAMGDCEDILQDLPANSVDLVFTSPPYYNAKPEYNDYLSYDEYLLKMRKVIHHSHRVLSEGRFFVINISPVLIRRANRNESSQRIAVPFDIHGLFMDENYDFIDDIIWEKPEGAGWATSRGRRFAADRNPLQYKPVPVTEYILVYRKHTSKLIDWNIRTHPNQESVKESKIGDDYDRTNIWRIVPAHDESHPAIFPLELAEKVIKYYSFKGDVVLDPFAGIGTVGKASINLKRNFILIEKEKTYIDIIRAEAKVWLGKEASQVLTINCPPIESGDMLL